MLFMFGKVMLTNDLSMCCLTQMIKRHLRRAPNAMVLVAAKKYYFGTGGSVQNFLDIVNAEGIFSASVVWEEQDYRSNIREIVQLKYA